MGEQDNIRLSGQPHGCFAFFLFFSRSTCGKQFLCQAFLTPKIFLRYGNCLVQVHGTLSLLLSLSSSSGEQWRNTTRMQTIELSKIPLHQCNL